MDEACRQGPLAGIKVVELGTHVAVPNMGRAMADCGAEVIKVEGLKGEEWRMLGKTYGIPYDEKENAFFTAQNSNKKFVALDLKHPEGKEILLKLLGEADVFLTNVRLKSLEKMGLDYESLKKTLPSLVYCHFTGFGYEGPDAARPGFDMAAFWARGGAMVDWNNTGDFPIKPVSGFGDAATSNLMLSGVLMALIGRQSSGRGTLVSSSLYGSSLWYNASGVILAQERYGNEFPKSRYAPANPTSHIYECADGNWIIITIIDFDGNRERFLRLMGMDRYLEDARFASFAAVKANIRGVVEALNAQFKTKTRDEWADIFAANDVVYEKLAHYQEIDKDPQAWANGYLEEVTFPSGEKLAMPHLPLLFSEYGVKKISPTTRVGADTDAVLAKMGYDPAQIETLKADQTVV